MKVLNFVFLIFAFSLQAFANDTNEVIIKGKTIGKIPDKLEYTVPVNGVCFSGFYKTVHPDSLGNFQFKVSIQSPAFLEFRFSGISGTPFIIEPGKNYQIIVDLTRKKGNIRFSNRSNLLLDLYSILPNPIHIQVGARNFLKDSVAAIVKSKILVERDNEIASLQKLYKEGEMSAGAFKLAKADRSCYYAALQGTIAYIKYCQGLGKPNWVFPAEMKNLWLDAFEQIDFSNPYILRSPWSSSLAENLVYFKMFMDKSFDLEKQREIRNQGLIHSHHLELATKELTGPLLEYYKSVYIYSQSIQKLYEKELVTLFNQFKKDYPRSSYLKFLEPEVASIIDYHGKIELPMGEKSKMVEGYATLNTLQEVLKIYKGKRLFIDVWATWCGPCKAEFAHKDTLCKVLNSNNMELLYLSIDKAEKDLQWKEMIKYYNLEGSRIRANDNLVTDLRRIYNQKGVIAIPWYLIIDENGTIVVEHAKSPSQIKELEKQLKEHIH